MWKTNNNKISVWHFLKILLIFGALVQTYVVAKNDVKIVFLKMNCSPISKKIKTLNCSTDFIQKRSTFSFHWTQSEDFRMLLAKTQVFVLQHDQRKLKLYDVQFDICQTLVKDSRRSLVQILVNRLKEGAHNLPKKCPLKKDVTFGYKNIYMNADIVPPYLPDINFTVTMNTFIGKEQLIAMQMEGIICNTQSTCQQFFN